MTSPAADKMADDIVVYHKVFGREYYWNWKLFLCAGVVEAGILLRKFIMFIFKTNFAADYDNPLYYQWIIACMNL